MGAIDARRHVVVASIFRNAPRTPDVPHLLFVEDNPKTRLLVKHLLNGTYDITLVPDAEAALQAMGETDFDGLLVDIHLGEGLGGTELLHRDREEKLAGGAPAIAVTAYAMPGDRQKYLEEGFDEYVGKPFTGADLRGAIDQVLESG